MKSHLTRNALVSIIFLYVFFGIPNYSFSQVGINTVSPQGILDVNSSTMGIVLPRVELSATNNMSPVINPETGSLAVGTTVFNTAKTSTGTNDVYPGIYSWDGSQWVGQYQKRQYSLYKSETGSYRSTPGNALTIPLNGSSSPSFTAKYTGEYKLLVRVDFGGGNAKPPREGSAANRSDGDLNIASGTGTFTLNFGGTNYLIPVNAYSTAYNAVTPATNYFAIWQEFAITEYVSLLADQTVSFSLTFTQSTVDRNEFDGNATSNGRGYVAYDIPCRVEISYTGD